MLVTSQGAASYAGCDEVVVSSEKQVNFLLEALLTLKIIPAYLVSLKDKDLAEMKQSWGRELSTEVKQKEQDLRRSSSHASDTIKSGAEDTEESNAGNSLLSCTGLTVLVLAKPDSNYFKDIPVHFWKAQHVSGWLKSLNLEIDTKPWRKQKIDGFSIMELTDEMLTKDLKVTASTLHKLKALIAILPQKRGFLDVPLPKWTSCLVCGWIESIGLDSEIWEKNEIDGKALLEMGQDSAVLVEMGLELVGDRITFQKRLRGLLESHSLSQS